ncbi:MAG: tRNA (guanosine(37)-N1)-methyltransferase TrmD [Gammaproteobacteria bacterium]
MCDQRSPLPLQIGVVTLFTEMFDALSYGVSARAIKNDCLKLHYWDPRDFADNEYRHIDDRPYGGGPGMIMRAQPLTAAILAAKQVLGQSTKTIYLSPQGRMIDQNRISQWSQAENLIFVAGRYEGIDERLMDTVIDEEWSIGDYILTGGEFAAMVVIDAVSRLLPGTLGNAESAQQESFSDGLLECPHYTRPATFDGLAVPQTLLGGDHRAIQRWRLKQSLGRSWLRRPDLLEKRPLTDPETSLLNEFKLECQLGQGKNDD